MERTIRFGQYTLTTRPIGKGMVQVTVRDLGAKYDIVMSMPMKEEHAQVYSEMFMVLGYMPVYDIEYMEAM